AAPAALASQPLGCRRAQEADKVVREVELVLVDLRVRHGIDAPGDRLAADRLFRRDGGIGHALLGDKGAVVELAQRGDEGLAAEPADPPVHVAVDAARDAVVVLVVRIGVGQDDRVGHERENAVEPRASPLEAVALLAGEPQQRISRLDDPAAGEGEGREPEGRRGPGAAHRVGSSFSTLSATSLPPARWHTTRTTSPGCTTITPPEAPAAAVPATPTPVGTL